MLVSALCLSYLLGFSGVSTDETLETKVQDVLQARKACGPTAAWYCLKRTGHEVDLDELRRLVDVDAEGTSLQVVVRSLREHGLDAKAIKCDVDRLLEMRVPAILIIDSHHCVVYDGYDPETKMVSCFDPFDMRKKSVSVAHVQQHWNGEAIVFEAVPLSNTRFCAFALLGALGIVLPATCFAGGRRRSRPRDAVPEQAA